MGFRLLWRLFFYLGLPFLNMNANFRLRKSIMKLKLNLPRGDEIHTRFSYFFIIGIYILLYNQLKGLEEENFRYEIFWEKKLVCIFTSIKRKVLGGKIRVFFLKISLLPKAMQYSNSKKYEYIIFKWPFCQRKYFTGKCIAFTSIYSDFLMYWLFKLRNRTENIQNIWRKVQKKKN